MSRSGPPHSRPGGYHDNTMRSTSSTSSGGHHDDSWSSSASRGQHPPPRSQQQQQPYHGRRTTAALDEDSGDDTDHHHSSSSHAGMESFHAEVVRPGRSRQHQQPAPPPQSSSSTHTMIGAATSTTQRPVAGGDMTHYASTQPEVETMRERACRVTNTMDRRTAGAAAPVVVSRPSPVYMNRNVSTGSSGGASVDSTIRRAQESMKSFQRSNDSAMNRLAPEEIPAPECSAKPEEPDLLPLRTSRRCLERVRQEQQQQKPAGRGMPSPQTTFVIGLPRQQQTPQQVDLLAAYPHHFMSVACESCQSAMIVPKTAVMVECPNCHKVGAATCSQVKSVTA